MKDKEKKQEVSRLKNVLIAQTMTNVINELGNKEKQYSTLVSEIYPNYQENIRLSVHCNKKSVLMYQKKFLFH
jgi:hypothetical protein